MEILDELGSTEQLLGLRAAALHVPFAGTFELIPTCNMNCKMCYIRTSEKNMQKQGRILSLEEWKSIALQAKELGLLYLLLTGGEPLLYPEFENLYQWLSENGIIVMLNTNGTLLTKEKADFLAKYPPRKVNISLYGACRETYGAVCGYAQGFDLVINAVNLLKERDIPVKLNCSLTPYNQDDLDDMHKLADKLNVPLQVTPYMFPPVRKNGIDAEEFLRFQPEEAAQMVIQNAKIVLEPQMYKKWVEEKLNIYEQYQNNPNLNKKCGFSCFASKNNFWINWKGEMLPCGMFSMQGQDVLKRGFKESWKIVGETGKNIANPLKCCQCDMRPLCQVCSAASVAETGRWDGTPDYLCAMTKQFLQLLKEGD